MKQLLIIITILLVTSPAYAGGTPAPNTSSTSHTIIDRENILSFDTYFPAPFGDYERIHLIPQIDLPSTDCNQDTEGDIYYSEDADGIMICYEDVINNSFEWVLVGSSIWELTGDILHLPSADTHVVIGTSNPVNSTALLHVQDGSVLFEGQVGGVPMEGPGTRFMWIPDKSALRAGKVDGTQWNNANIGQSSIALGSNAMAFGNRSIALGSDVSAIANESVAMGTNSYVRDNAYRGIAAGYNAKVYARYGIALGKNTEAGDSTLATNMLFNFAAGDGAIATGGKAFATGHNTEAAGINSIAMGDSSVAVGDDSIAMGYGARTTAAAINSMAIGHDVAATGLNNFVMGHGTSNVLPLTNEFPKSFMVGFSSNPTLFVRDGHVGINTTINDSMDLLVYGDASKSVAGNWKVMSDRRIKTDIHDLKNALDIIDKIRPVRYRYSGDYLARYPSIKDRDYYHFIAQEFQELFPNSVHEGDEGYLYMEPGPVVPYLVSAVQELKTKAEALIVENEELELEIEELKGSKQ